MDEEKSELTEKEWELLRLLDEDLELPPLPPDFENSVLAQLGIPSDVPLSETDTGPELTEEERALLRQFDEDVDLPPLPPDFISNVLARLGITDSPVPESSAVESIETDPTAVYLAILKQNESLAKELGFTQSVLANFFNILEQQHVPLKELDAKLREIAVSHKQFQQRLQTIDLDNAESSRLYAEALAAAERGEYAYARTLLDEADRMDSEAIEALEARSDKKLLTRAATSAAKGDSYKTQLRYGEAAACYRQAVAFVEQIPEGNERELEIYLSLLG